MIPLYLELKQQGFNFVIFPYLFKIFHHCRTFRASATVEQDQIIGGVQGKPQLNGGTLTSPNKILTDAAHYDVHG
jgi:hypothetical protein